MSYPVLSPSIQFARPAWRKTPHFNTITQKPAAVRGIVTASLVPYPTWDFEVELVWTRGDERTPTSIIAAFLDIFMQCLGSGVFFLITDPNDNTVSANAGTMLNVTPGAAAPMGVVGDGVSTQFQLARIIGPSGLSIDILQNVSISTLNVNGSPTSSYSVSDTGVITFVTAPALNASLSWSGGFQYLCQFTEDTLSDLGRVGVIPNVLTPSVMDGLWSCGNIKFSSIFV